MTITGRLDYENNRTSERAIQIEPWGQEFFLKPESRLRLEVECGCAGPFEVLEYDETTAIWVWSPCKARIWIDGVERTTPFMGEPFPA